jgi:hypothetical protein
MSARALILATAVLSVACGGGSSGSTPNGTPAPACSTTQESTIVLNGSDVYDALTVQNGFAYLEIPGEGVVRCPTTGCSASSSIVGNPAYVSSVVASNITYTTQIASTTGPGITGEIRVSSADGTSDQSLLAGVTYPAFVAVSGTRTFWIEDSFAIDDTPATVSCVGCDSSGASASWMTGLGGGTYGMIADANNVYVLADDPTLTTVQLLACSVETSCFSEPRVVIGQLDQTVTTQELASDGTYVYVARATQNDVVRVDAAGNVTSVVTSQSVSAIVVDVAAGNLYYGTSSGLVGRIKSDGTGTSVTLACTGATIAALDVDATRVYWVTGASGSNVAKAAK